MSNEHQPGSPGAVDLDEFDRLLATHRTSTDADAVTDAVVRLTRALPRMLAEVRTLRARVGELEAENSRRKEHERAAILEMAKARNEKMDAQMRGDLNAWLVHDFEEERGEGLVKKLWDKAKEQHKRITDLEAQLAAAREEQCLEAKVREVLRGGFEVLKFERMLVNEQPAWFCDTRIIWPHHSFVSATTLPALLRAILEVEAKGAR